MSPDLLDHPRPSKRGEPVWQMASLYPLQGYWTENAYLGLDVPRLIEYHDGMLEFLPMPSALHQRIVRLLARLIEDWAAKHAGEVFAAPMPLATVPKSYREPDLMYVRDPGAVQHEDRRVSFAEVVVEVVSEGEENRERDYNEKRKEYAQAGIPEYWIVDPEERKILVLILREGTYTEHQVASFEDVARSATLNGFEVRLADTFPKDGK